MKQFRMRPQANWMNANSTTAGYNGKSSAPSTLLGQVNIDALGAA